RAFSASGSSAGRAAPAGRAFVPSSAARAVAAGNRAAKLNNPGTSSDTTSRTRIGTLAIVSGSAEPGKSSPARELRAVSAGSRPSGYDRLVTIVGARPSGHDRLVTTVWLRPSGSWSQL